MEGRSEFVPSHCQGMSILVVDNDENSLNYLSSLLQRFSYKVTSTELATSALWMVESKQERFELVMANVNIPDMDILQFLHLMVDKDIPVILVSKEQSVSQAKKALAEGASSYMIEPICPVYLHLIWQYAYKKKRIQTENAEKTVMNNEENGSQSEQEGKTSENTSAGSKMKRQVEEKQGQNGEDKRVKINDEEVKKNWTLLLEGNKEDKNKKSRFVWTPDLHFKFIEAISKLGDKKIRPKPILENMQVPNLTARQVASHLQKFRCQVQKIYEIGNIIDLPPVTRSSNFHGSTGIFNNTTTAPSFSSFAINGNTPALTFPIETSNQVSFMSNWKKQELDFIALIKSLDDDYQNVAVSNPSNGQDQAAKNVVETSNNIIDGEDGFDEWLNDITSLDITEMPNMDMIVESDAHEDAVNVVEKDKTVSEPSPSDFNRCLEWLSQVLLEED